MGPSRVLEPFNSPFFQQRENDRESPLMFVETKKPDGNPGLNRQTSLKIREPPLPLDLNYIHP